MKKIMYLLSFFVSILPFIIAPNSSSQNTDPNMVVLFEDDFDGELQSAWALDSSWRVEEERRNHYLAGAQHTWANLNLGHEWTDYQVTLKFRLINEAFHLMVRLSDKGRYYVGVGDDGIALNKQFFPDTFLPNLDLDEDRIMKEEWHTITVTAIGNRIRIALDGINRIDYIDENEPFLQGNFALETIWDEESRVHFDDVSITGFEPIPIPTPTTRPVSTRIPSPTPFLRPTPTHTHTPIPTRRSTHTPARTPTRVIPTRTPTRIIPTSTPTRTPRATNTQTYAPIPTFPSGDSESGEVLWAYRFSASDPEGDGVTITAPAVSSMGNFRSGGVVPQDEFQERSDGVGGTFIASPGKGNLLFFPVQPVASGGVIVRIGVRAEGASAQIALGALDANQANGLMNMDGSIATRILTSSQNVRNQWHTISLYIDPYLNGIVPLIQVVSTSRVGISTVYVDNLEIIGLSVEEAASMIDPGIKKRSGFAPENSSLGETVWNYNFSNRDENPNDLTIVAPGNPGDFDLASLISGSSIPNDESQIMSDGIGAFVNIASRMGLSIFCPVQKVGTGGALVTVSVRADGSGAQLALGALDSSEAEGLQGLDGSITTRIPATTGYFREGWHRLAQYIDPGLSNKNRIVPVVQIASISNERTTVFLDNIKVTALSAEEATQLKLRSSTTTQVPPITLYLGGFTLAVESYDRFTWTDWDPLDRAYKGMKEASGTAWTSFNCSEYSAALSLSPVETVNFIVVDTVDDPSTQISLLEALSFNPDIKTGQILQLTLPNDFSLDEPISADRVAETMQIQKYLLGYLVADLGKIKVKFDDLTIDCKTGPNYSDYYGDVTNGTAQYPTVPAIPVKPIQLYVAGFNLFLSSLVINPGGGTGIAELEFPPSIASSNDCRPAYMDLGEISITADCQFYRSLPNGEYGPWTIDSTGMTIEGNEKGKGFIADFSTIFPWGHSDGPWRGVILSNGQTVPAPSDSIVSNSGYLKAAYDYTNARITATGFTGDFTLDQPYTFKTLNPFGYDVRINQGTLSMKDSQVTEGNFSDGWIDLPIKAVVDKSDSNGDKRIRGKFSGLIVQNDLDLYGEVEIDQDIWWGEFSNHSSPFYSVRSIAENTQSYFYLIGSFDDNLSPYWPLSGTGKDTLFINPSFADPKMENNLEKQGIQGVTIQFAQSTRNNPIAQFDIFTPDTPNQAKLTFSHIRIKESWLNVASQGVHGCIVIIDPPVMEKTRELGPTHNKDSYYIGAFPFITNLGDRLEFQYVDSAVYFSDVNGDVYLPWPVDDHLPFQDMQFTSSANIAAASVVLPDNPPVELKYWGLQLVPRPGITTSGVMSVKSGQIFLTAAGIQERRIDPSTGLSQRHFERPFWLTWGEILADGNLGRLFFDYNPDGQTFDGFPFETDCIALSDYDTRNPPPYLHVGGRAFFDFFGPNYCNILDFYDPSLDDFPFYQRKIELCVDKNDLWCNQFDVTVDDIAIIDPRCGCETETRPTNRHISRNWGAGRDQFDYCTHYDTGDQDGFKGPGIMRFERIEGDILSTINLSSAKISLEASDNNHHKFDLGPFDDFGSIQSIQTSAPALIQNGKLEEIKLMASLSDKGRYLGIGAGASVLWTCFMQPSNSHMNVSGKCIIKREIFEGVDLGNLSVNGNINYNISRNLDFQLPDSVHGTIVANIKAEIEKLDLLKADGLLDWDFGFDDKGGEYWAIQSSLDDVTIFGIGLGGGFYIGYNAPKENARVIKDPDGSGHYEIDMSTLPDRLTGIYGWGKFGKSLPAELLISGGYRGFADLGYFIKPYSYVGGVGFEVWADFIIGRAYNSGRWRIDVPTGFSGKLDLEICVNPCCLWDCSSCIGVTLGITLTVDDGLGISVF